MLQEQGRRAECSVPPLRAPHAEPGTSTSHAEPSTSTSYPEQARAPRTQDAATDCLAAPHLPRSRDRHVPRLDAIWEQLFPAEQQRIVRLLIDKVIVSPDDLEVRFRPNGIEVLVLELQPEPDDETVEEELA